MKTFTHKYDYILITGPTGSGKSSITKKLINDYGMECKKKYTTRPKRPNECDLEYEFVTSNDMNALEQNGWLLSRIRPVAAHGVWEYGIPVYKDLMYEHRTNVQVLGLNDVENIIRLHGTDWFPNNSLLIVLFVDVPTLLSLGLNSRNDSEENTRRVTSDIKLLGEHPDDNAPIYQKIVDMWDRNSQFRFVNIVNHGFQLSVDNILDDIESTQRVIFHSRRLTIFK